MNQNPKCHWCSNDAKRQDYREVDGSISKVKSCDTCYYIGTKELLKRKYKKNAT